MDRTWCIIDNCLRHGAFEVTEPYASKEEALEAAEKEWNHMADIDRKHRDEYYVGLCDYDIETESWTEVYEIAKRWK